MDYLVICENILLWRLSKVYLHNVLHHYVALFRYFSDYIRDAKRIIWVVFWKHGKLAFFCYRLVNKLPKYMIFNDMSLKGCVHIQEYYRIQAVWSCLSFKLKVNICCLWGICKYLMKCLVGTDSLHFITVTIVTWSTVLTHIPQWYILVYMYQLRDSNTFEIKTHKNTFVYWLFCTTHTHKSKYQMQMSWHNIMHEM